MDILAEKTGTLKYASAISKKSQTISLVWFRELAWTAQKAALNLDIGWREGQKQQIRDKQESTTSLTYLCQRNCRREETSQN